MDRLVPFRTHVAQGEHPAEAVVLHLVGRVTDAVFSFLGPATESLAERGVDQILVMLDDPQHRHLMPRFHESIRLHPISASGRFVDDWGRLLDAYCDVARRRQPLVAHLHGVMCSFLGTYAARFRGIDVPTYFSPHGSRLLGPAHGLRAALPKRWQPLPGIRRHVAIASSVADARTLGELTHESIAVLESPVGDAFFALCREPADPPVVMTETRGVDPYGAALFAQCAVLLGDQPSGLQFVWAGTPDPESTVRLKAAEVDVREALDDASRLARLQRSRIFVAPAGGRGFPIFLAEAMAAGLPCVTWDTSFHRDLIVDGETGYLCAGIADVIERISKLSKSPELCERIGQAARAEACRRFDERRFRDSLFRFYATGLERGSTTSPGSGR